MFGRRNKRNAFTPPPGLNTTPQALVRSAPFAYVPEESSIVLTKGDRVSLSKDLVDGYDAALAALKAVGLHGLRAEVIVMVDDSGSMGREYRDGLVQRMLTRFLGFAMHISVSGKVQMLAYGRPNQPVTITKDNYQQADQLIRPTFGSTPMTEALTAALALAEANNVLTLIVNLTDGNPDRKVTMSNEVIRSSGHPVIIKNLAVKNVPYLQEIDDLPSQIEIQKDENDEKPVKNADGTLVLYRRQDGTGIRLIDNVDSQGIDPYNASDEEFAAAIAEEVNECVEVMGNVGLLTGVPGVVRTF